MSGDKYIIDIFRRKAAGEVTRREDKATALKPRSVGVISRCSGGSMHLMSMGLIVIILTFSCLLCGVDLINGYPEHNEKSSNPCK